MENFADYHLLESLGEGGAAKVYLATPLIHKPFAKPGDPVALKIYKHEVLKEKEQLERISHELKASIQAAHPNVVKALDCDADHSDGPYLVMEYVDGMPLSRWGAMYCPLSDRLLTTLVTQLVAGIAALHRVEIIHRDLKPDNVMISSSFDAKIMDLGVVRLTRDSHITPEERFLGTYRNSSPEMLLGKEYDLRTDIYSLGTIIYFLLHGYEVFHETNHRNQLVIRVLNEEVKFNEAVKNRSQTSAKLADLAERMLRKLPEERFQSIEDVNRELQSIVGVVADSKRPLHGYVASALTNLPPEVRGHVAFTTDAIARTCKGFDLYVYQPRKATDPIVHAKISPEAVYELDRKRILDADVLIVLANQPSFGVGQEIEIAGGMGTPTILLRREGISLSRMVTGSFLNIQADIEYDPHSPEDLEQKLHQALPPVLQGIRSREATSDGPLQKIGQRLRELRETAGFNQEEVATALGVSRHLVRAVEERPPSYHNAGIVVLDRMTKLYGASVKNLVDDRAQKSRVPREDKNLRSLERVAVRQKWSAEDYLELMKDYQKELAASGASPTIDEKDWLDRHRSIEERRFKDGSDVEGKARTVKNQPSQLKLV